MALSTSGLGRSPLKAKTRVRTSLRLPLKIKLRNQRPSQEKRGGFLLSES